ATSQARVAATVLSKAESGVTGNLPAVAEAAPIANLPIDDHTGHQAQSAWLVECSGRLQLKSQRADLFLQRKQDGLAVLEQLFHPSWHLERSKVALLPPALHRLNPVIYHETAALRPDLFTRFDQLLPLPVNGAQLFFFFARHAHQRQSRAVALDKTVQLQAERLGIQPVSLYSPVVLVQFLRTDHIT